MANKRKILMCVFLLLLILLATGCFRKKKDTTQSTQEIRTGTNGIGISFLPNNPPPTLIVSQSAPATFDTIVEIINRGAYPQPDESTAINGKVYIGGYDKNIIKFSPIDPPSYDLSKSSSLQGKILASLEGNSELVTFNGIVSYDDLKVEKYEASFLATACYQYSTLAGPSVCIDPDPYSQIKQQKVCTVQIIALTSQGAPIAITSIVPTARSDNMQFLITIKNVGLGDVLVKEQDSSAQQSQQQSINSIEKCNPFGGAKLTKDDINKVFVEEVSIGNEPLLCQPFSGTNAKSDKGNVRLDDKGEGTIRCELFKSGIGAYSDAKTSYTTPLRIKLSYVYRTTAQTKMLVQKEEST